MEADKFEKHIKSQLRERKIEPSLRAWEKISSELDTTTKVKKLPMLWMGIAASVVVIMGITLFYIHNAEENSNSPILVGVEEKPAPEAKQNTNYGVTQQDKIEAFQMESEVVKNADNVDHEAKGIIVPKSFAERREVSTEIKISHKKDTKDENISLVAAVDEKIINTKVEEVLARVNNMERNGLVTDAEVDSLLKRAQQEIINEKIFRTDASVDAMALLTEVEEELDQSFRDQIFNSLKTGFIKVRTAVADRNN